MVRTDLTPVAPTPNPVLAHARACKYDSATRVSRIQRFGCSGTPMAEKYIYQKPSVQALTTFSLRDVSVPVSADHYGSAEIMFVRAARCVLA